MHFLVFPGNQGNEWAVKYVGDFFKNLSVWKKYETEDKSIYISRYISNRKIKYEDKYAFWNKLC